MSETERRAFTRRIAHLEVVLEEGVVAFPAELVDISLCGAFVRPERAPAPDALCRLLLREGDAAGAPLILRGRVVGAHGGGVGLRFEEVSFEALERLRAFLVVLGEDPARMEGELERHWSSPPGAEPTASTAPSRLPS